MAIVNDEPNVKHEHRTKGSCCTNNGVAIAKKLKSTGKDLAIIEMSPMIGEHCTIYYTSPCISCKEAFYQSCKSGLSKVHFDLLREGVMRDKLDAHIAKFFDPDAAADRLSKRSLTSSKPMGPIAIFARGKTDTAIEDKK